MLLEAVERFVWIEQRICVVEAGHEADRQLPVRQRVDEPPTELLMPEWVPHRMYDRADIEWAAGHLPEFLDPDGELLRLPAVAEIKTSPQLLWSDCRAHRRRKS